MPIVLIGGYGPRFAELVDCRVEKSLRENLALPCGLIHERFKQLYLDSDSDIGQVRLLRGANRGVSFHFKSVHWEFVLALCYPWP